MRLRFLDFDHSEDTDGHGTFEAMATVGPAHWPDLQAEVVQVLDWAQRAFPGGPAPLDEGGDWDCQLDGQEETVQALALERAGTGLSVRPQGPAQCRHTLTLTLSGPPAFVEAFREGVLEDETPALPRRGRR